MPTNLDFSDTAEIRERMEDLWTQFCESINEGADPRGNERNLYVPFAAQNEDHEDHAIYKAWLAVEELVTLRMHRIAVDQSDLEYERLRAEARDEP